jgi:hypothetical protein
MIQALMTLFRRPFLLAAVGMFLGGVIALPAPAVARVWVGFGFPLVVGPPAYYAPPAYYPPAVYYPTPPYYPPPYYPPAPPYYPPPAQYSQAPRAVPSGQTCNTGGTVCPMERPVSPGTACYCTTAQGKAWGRAS